MSHSKQTENLPSIFQNAPLELLNPIKITDTLQGTIWRAATTDKGTVVVKLTNRNQHNTSTATFGDKVYRNIKENILLEQSIVKYLTHHIDCPPSIAKFISFSETADFFVFIQEDGGSSLFDFVRIAHTLIQAGTIEVNHWKTVVKVIFKQLIECIAFIHSKRVCHNDISLENFLINDVDITVEAGASSKIQFATEDIRIKLCDFGLAELHANSQCLSSKHCGKTQYKSPEMSNVNKRFDAKKNDLWGIGVCLFMLSFGCPPWRAARVTEEAFDCIMSGRMVDVLRAWNLSIYIDEHIMHALESIFQCEKDRISVRRMQQYLYFLSQK